MKNKIFFVRHGENPANVLKQLSSRKIDYPLNERGRLQAGQTAEYFSCLAIDEVHASPLKRAIETAQIIAAPHGLEIEVRENFREVYTGDLEDRPDSEESWRGWYEVTGDWFEGKLSTRFPNGENCVMVRDRLRAGLEEILAGKDGRNILVVTHIGLMMATIADLCPDVNLADLISIETQNCAITEIDMHRLNGCWNGKLVRWSDFSHLHGEAANFTPALKQVKIN